MGFDVPPPVPALEVSIASRGYSKGVAQTDGPQVVVRPEVTFGGLRIAAYGKNVTSSQFDGEIGVSIGYKRVFGKTELAGSATVKRLVDAGPCADTSALELNVTVARSRGAFKPKVSLTYSPDDLAATGRSAFWEAGSTYQLDKNFSLQAGIGIRSRTGGANYTSFTAAATRSIGRRFTIEVRLYDTNRDAIGDYYRRRAIVSLRARI